MKRTTVIDVSDLNVSYGHGASTVHAVRGASLKVEQGSCFGLVGESGSGKTTVLSALCGLNRQWRGDVTIAGRPLQGRYGRAFYRRVQMVFQDPYGSLHPRHTVDTALNEPLAIHRIADRSRRVDRVLRDVGLDHSFRYRYPHQLSGGQRQRVAIARALILEPSIVLLDEPTSALDVSVQAEILNLLTALRRDRGLTYVLVSHNLAVVSHMCDRLTVMNAGHIVEELSVKQLRAGEFQHPYTEQLFRASLGYDRATVDAFQTFD